MNVVPRPRNGLSLCAGAGGLDMGLMLAEPGFHTRCFVEWEEYPRDAIIAAQAAGYFAPAPIWDDVTTFDGRPLAGAIDTILAGYPCQPFSHAGERRGEQDERHLWPDVARIIREIGPTWVFLENVAGHVSLGLETVLRELWDMGFTPAAGLFSAGEVGAPHERQRVFIVAYRDNRTSQLPAGSARGGRGEFAGNGTGLDVAARGLGGLYTGQGRSRGGTADLAGAGDALADAGDGQFSQPGRGSEGRNGAGSGIEGMDNTLGLGRQAGRGGDGRHDRHEPCADGGQLADSSITGLPGGERLGDIAHGSASERGCTPIFPPGPTDTEAWRAILGVAPDLAPSLSFGDIARRAAQLGALVAAGGLEEAAAESDLRGVVDGLAQRSRALRLLGNGVLPLAAGYAWRSLSEAHGLGALDLEAAGCA